jgi:hypothetical protein
VEKGDSAVTHLTGVRLQTLSQSRLFRSIPRLFRANYLLESQAKKVLINSLDTVKPERYDFQPLELLLGVKRRISCFIHTDLPVERPSYFEMHVGNFRSRSMSRDAETTSAARFT